MDLPEPPHLARSLAVLSLCRPPFFRLPPSPFSSRVVFPSLLSAPACGLGLLGSLARLVWFLGPCSAPPPSSAPPPPSYASYLISPPCPFLWPTQACWFLGSLGQACAHRVTPPRWCSFVSGQAPWPQGGEPCVSVLKAALLLRIQCASIAVARRHPRK